MCKLCIFFFTQGGRATTRPGPLISVHWDLKTEPVLRPEPEYFIFHRVNTAKLCVCMCVLKILIHSS